jgi:hypothetical protein
LASIAYFLVVGMLSGQTPGKISAIDTAKPGSDLSEGVFTGAPPTRRRTKHRWAEQRENRRSA